MLSLGALLPPTDRRYRVSVTRVRSAPADTDSSGPIARATSRAVPLAISALIFVVVWKAALLAFGTAPQARRVLSASTAQSSGSHVLIGSPGDSARYVRRLTAGSAGEPQIFTLLVPNRGGIADRALPLVRSLGHVPPVLITMDGQGRIVRVLPLTTSHANAER